VSVLVTLLGLGSLAQAQVVQPFNIRYQINTKGDIVLIGNTLSTCSNNCDRSAVGTSNGNILSAPVDVDALGSNSSTATLTLPGGSNVLFAGLYWGSRTDAALSGTTTTVRFQTPSSGSYTTLTSDSLYKTTASGTNPYGAFKDVTTLVRAAGSGTYRAGGIALNTASDGLGGYGGWSLVVAYGDSSATLRNLTVFDGFARIDGTNPVTTSVSGFLTPPAGAVNGRIGAVAYEGDGPITGDQMLFNGTALTDAQTPSTNFFNSAIEDLGTRITAKNPDYANQLGFDVHRIAAPAGAIPNGASSATVQFTTSGDVYFPQVITTAIDAYLPDFSGITKTVTDLNGGSLAPGDVLEYTITATNTGQDNATNSVLTDPIPANTTYKPGSLQILSGANAGTKTDAVADDQAEFVTASNQVVFRLGTGANGTTGGTLAPNSSFSLKFQVTLNAGVSGGTTVNNQVTMTYKSATDTTLSLQANATATSTVAAPPIDVVKSAGAPTAVTGTPNAFDVPFTVKVGNQAAAGGVTATNVQVNDYLRGTFTSGAPTITVSGLTASGVGGATCTVDSSFNGDTNTRLLSGSNSLAPAQSCTITFTARVAYPNAAAVPSAAQNNTAYASSVTGAGPNAGYTFPGGTPTAPTGSGAGTVTTDTSTNGGALPATPNADTASPTPVSLSLNKIDVVKSAGSPVPVSTTAFDVPYTAKVGNATGQPTLSNVQVSENLALTFSSGNPTFTVSGLTATGVGGATCTANSGFNGTANYGLLAGTDNLAAGQSCTITFTVRVTYPSVAAIPTTAQNNTAYASSGTSSPNPGYTFPGGTPTPPTGALATDNSTNASGLPATANGDTASPTPVTFSPNKIDTVKSVGAPIKVDNRTFDVPYTVKVGNATGQPSLPNVQASENLSLTFSSGSPTITVSGLAATGVGGVTCTVNSSFNGTSNYGLLAGADSLAASQSCTITFTVRVTYPSAAAIPTTAQSNSIYASSTPTGPNPGYTFPGGTPTAPTGAVALDTSTNASGLPATGNSDTASPTPVTLSSAVIGTAKAVVGAPVKQANGSYNINYSVLVKNYGNVVLNGVQATDDLGATFPAPTSFIVSNVAGANSNSSFNGVGNKNLLAAGVNLNPGETRTVTFTVNVVPNNSFGPFNNSVTATGTPPTGPAISDVSNNGTDPDPNNNSNPGDPGEDTPTPVKLAANPQIGTAKSASASAVKGDGSYDVTYSVIVKNIGDITLQNVTATDDLSATFGATPFNLTTVSGSGANGGFNGASNQNLLTSGVNLNPGESRTVTLVVNVKPSGSNFGPFNNSVTAQGTPPATTANPNPTAVTDISNNGTNPDPNNNGNANEPGENTPTPISFSPNPVIGTAKGATAPVLQADGSYLVTYTVLVKNLGNTVLNGAQATDNLGLTFPAPTTFSVTSVSGSSANAGFNGASNQNLLTAGVTLNPGDSRTVSFTVRIVPNGAFGPFNNSATASGTPPTGPAVTDVSTNGSNPDPNGNGKPNDPGEDAPTPVNLNPNPVIGTAKAVSGGPTRLANGSYDITYSVVIKNYGNVDLQNVSAKDDLTLTFQSPATFSLKSISGTGANASFNGASDTNLLAAGSSLAVGQSRTVQFTVNVVPNGSFGPFSNSVTAQGTPPATVANPNPSPVSDVSNDGTDPNPSGDNTPNKPSENAPTTVSLAPNAVIGTAKSVSAAIRQADGSYNLTYTVLVRNYGNTVLNGVQATDNLTSTFPSPTTFTVSSVTGTDANAGFNGSSNKNLLAAGVSLNPDESRTVTFNLNIKPNGSFGPFDNTVLASGTPPATATNPTPSAVSDLSTDGTNPDPNGNGDPTQSGENTPTRTSLTPNPVIGVAKAASAAIRQASGSYTLTYTVVVQNYGNIRLENVTATDNLALTFPAPTTFTVSNVTGSGANAGFNGSSDKNLLGAGIALESGESRTITYTVNVAPNGAFGPFDNSVLASGTTPSGTPGGSQTVTDTSNSGTDPNPSGDRDPTKPSENTPTRVSFTPNPLIGSAKSATAAALQPDGSYNITYNVLVQNYGNVVLSNVQGTDDLSATFPAPATFTVTGVSGTNANPSFNGSSDKTLLTAGVTLNPGESRTVTFSVNVKPNGNFGPFNNNVIAKGTPPGAPPVTDVSDNSNSGLNPDPNGDGDPTEPGENNPTVVTLTPKPVIGIAKSASSSGVLADGSYNITYSVLVKNYGNTVLYDAQTTDDLTTTFPAPATFSVSSVTGADANAGFDGKANKKLLKDGIALNPGETRTVSFVVNLKPGVNNLGPFNNAALASGTPPSTTSNPNPTPVTDVSNNGTDPNPSGDGDPTQPTENKPTPVNLAPNPVIGVAKAAGPALLQPNGSYTVTYTVVVKNYGNVTLSNAQATDDLLQTFPAPTTFLTSGVTGTGANLGFNGASDKNLLAAGVTLNPGESRTVSFTAIIVPNGVFGPFNNTVLATGTAPATGGNPAQTVSDRSTDGTNPNPSGDGDPTKPSENKPTPVTLAPKPVIGTAKAVSSGPTLNADGSFDVSFVVYVKNYGNTVLNNATATDDLAATFPSPATFTVTGVTGTGANSSFNGSSNKNLLAAGTSLAIGESRRIAFTVKVTPNGNYGPFSNAVIAQGTVPASGGNPAQTVSDRSNDDPTFNKTDPNAVPNPDPNGNNDPTELTENNPTPVNVNPVPLAAGKLRLTKTVNQPVARVGEPLTYTLEATNDSSVPMLDLKLDDVLPFGLIYRAGSSLVGGQAIEPTVTTQADAKGRQVQRLVWTVPGALAPAGKARVQFSVNVTPLVPEGDLINTATASAFGGQVKSNAASAAVKVDLGVFTNNIVIVGRVYFDANDNNSFEAGIDTPLPGARVYLSDGRFAVTDAQGRYSIPNVAPGLYAIRLDPLTAPYAPKPVPDDQGQRGTRYVRPGIGGGIDNEDFPLYPARGAAVKARSTTVSRGAVTLVKSLQQGGAGYAIQITLSIDKPVANLTLTDPLPAGATRGPVTLTGPNGVTIPVTVQDGKLVVAGTLEPGKYTLTYAIFTGLPPEQVVTDPDINYDEVVR
jgi:uncharacterized repeat protein (TIGR01451 family)